MNRSKRAIPNLIDKHSVAPKKNCIRSLCRALAEVGLLVVGSAGAETVNDFQALQQAVLDQETSEILIGRNIVLESRLQGKTAVERSLRIDGGGYTISGSHPAFWFADMPSGTVSIVNVHFDGQKSTSSDKYDQPIPFGPSVYFNMNDWKSEAVLNIGNGVTFQNNEAVVDSAGGAIRTAHGTVNIGDNVTFKHNKGGAGGALYAESFTTIGNNVLFEGNEGRRGGALDVIDDYTDYLSDPDYLAGRRKPKYVHIGKNARFIDNKVALMGGHGNGGAIEVQSDELTIDDGAVFSGNVSDGTGGALSIVEWSPQLPGKVALGTVSFLENIATYGGAIINEGDLSLNGTGSFTENRAKSIGGAIYNSGTTVFHAHGDFSKNTASVAGAAYNAGMMVFSGNSTFSENTASTGGAILNEGTVSFKGTTDFSGNQSSEDGGAIYNTNILTFGDGTVFANNTAERDGGALYNDASASNGTIVSTGNVRFDGGASFTGNKAITGHGGALYNLYNVTLNPGTGQEILFRGNTDSTGANAVYMAKDSRLDVMGAGSVVFDDPLSFEDATPMLKKSGGGTLLFNADMDGFLGSVELDGGATKVIHEWKILNKVTLHGGSLDLPSFSFAEADGMGNIAGGTLAITGGTLVTNTAQLFQNALDADGTTTDPEDLKPSVSGHINFVSGGISFNDAKYNLQYAGSAAQLLDARYGESESQPGDREITFTGDLYTGFVPAPEPDPIPGPTDTVSIDDLNKNDINNVVLGNVTITTTGTDATTGKNLVVGSTHVDNPKFSDAQALPGSIGGRNLHLGTEGSGVAVVGGHYLTLVGGESGTSLIEAGSDGNRPVDVHVGETVNGVMSEGTLNLGTTAMPSGGILNGNVQIAESSVLNVRAGEHSISGESVTVDQTVQTVAGVTNNGGTLDIAGPATLNATVKQTAGKTDVAGTLISSSVEVESGQFNVAGMAKIDRLMQRDGETAISGTIETALLEADKGKVQVNGTLKADRLVASDALNITVGNENAAGKLYAQSASLKGGTIFFDPIWKGTDTVETASHGAMVFDDNQGVDGKLGVGRNSLLVLGEASTGRTLGLFNNSGLHWGQDGITAALSIRAPQRLDPTKGAIMVDGSLTAAPLLAPNTVTFGAGSLFMVDTAGLNGRAALTSENGSLKVDGNASLLLEHVTAGEHAITTGFTDNADVSGWEGSRLSTPDQLIGLSLDKSVSGTVKVQATALDAGTVLPGVALPNILHEIWDNGRNDTDSVNAGIAFLSKAVDTRYVASGDTVRTLNGAAQIAIAAGVQPTAIQVSDTVNRALQDRLSINSETGLSETPALRREGGDLWASMLYRRNDSSGIRAGGFSADYENDFGGILVGADYTWTVSGASRFRAGGALNAGKGEGKSHGDFNHTRNDYDTYGISAYGSWSQTHTNFTVDIGYLKGDNELKQSIPAALGGSLKADVDTQVWTVGTQGEYRFATGALDITPHIGVRYLRVKTDAFDTRNRLGTVFHTGNDTQNIWQIPVGVTLSKNYMVQNGWTIKPKLDVSFIPATGDRDASTRVHVPGVGASDTMTTEIMDSTSWSGSLGLDMMKDRTRFGIRAGYQKSGMDRTRGAMLTINRQFD